jgi:hypothetical protein
MPIATLSGDTHRDDLVEIDGRGAGEGPERPGADHPKLGPAPQEGGEGPIGFAQIDIRPTGFGQHRAQLGQREGPAKGDDADGYPDADDQREIIQRLGHRANFPDEDPRSDDRADDHHGGIEEPQHPGELGRVVIGSRGGSVGNLGHTRLPGRGRKRKSVCRLMVAGKPGGLHQIPPDRHGIGPHTDPHSPNNISQRCVA